MNHHRIVESLNGWFLTQNIVFWQDPEGEFSEVIGSLPLEGIRLIRLDDVPALKVKIDIEYGNPSDKWLLYSPHSEPDPEKDWLLDIRLRSKTFQADPYSLLLEDLGLSTQSLRPYLKTRTTFFRSKDRVERLMRWVVPEDTAESLDLKLIGVLVRSDQPDIFRILLCLYKSLVEGDEVNLDGLPKAWQDIVANDLETAFWKLVRKMFGYGETLPSLRDLLFHLLVTDFSASCRGMVPEGLKSFVLSEKALSSNAAVFFGRWRSDINYCSCYNAISRAVAEELGIQKVLADLSAEDLLHSMTFEGIERQIIQELKKRILAGSGNNMDSIRAIIASRRDGYWANRHLAETNSTNKALIASYDALEAAASFLELKEHYSGGFSFTDALAGFRQYQSELFRFDQLYRNFHYAADLVEPMGWALLHELQTQIETFYSGWFMPQLASAWSKVLEGERGLLSSWNDPLLMNQQSFYQKKIKPLLNNGSGNRRIFVIVSDAFRFEAAEELTRRINRRNRLEAKLEGMLGVLPSYTALGMAALLPHETLSYKINSSLEVMADGQSVGSIEQKSTHLKTFDGIAIKSDDLLSYGKERGREFVQKYRLIYIYHDKIDQVGDKQGSETQTFEAVVKALDEIEELATFIINSLNGSLIMITADHGFLYQDVPLEEVDRAKLWEKPMGTLWDKKRFLLGQDLGVNPQVWYGNTSLTAGTEKGERSLDFWVPKGVTRFHFVGGARFVHGGAMPQEILIPLITLREKDSEKTRTRSVEFSLLGVSNKVVTNKQRFEFIQTEAVSERVLPRKVVISLRDGDRLISDEQTLTFDSTSPLMEERKRSVILTVLSGSYEKSRDYFLVVRDVKTKVEISRTTLKVDLAFANDF